MVRQWHFISFLAMFHGDIHEVWDMKTIKQLQAFLAIDARAEA